MSRHCSHGCFCLLWKRLPTATIWHRATRFVYISEPDHKGTGQFGSRLRQQTTWRLLPSPLRLSGSLFDCHLPWTLALAGSNSRLTLLQDHLSTGPSADAHILSSSILFAAFSRPEAPSDLEVPLSYGKDWDFFSWMREKSALFNSYLLMMQPKLPSLLCEMCKRWSLQCASSSVDSSWLYFLHCIINEKPHRKGVHELTLWNQHAC